MPFSFRAQLDQIYYCGELGLVDRASQSSNTVKENCLSTASLRFSSSVKFGWRKQTTLRWTSISCMVRNNNKKQLLFSQSLSGFYNCEIFCRITIKYSLWTRSFNFLIFNRILRLASVDIDSNSAVRYYNYARRVKRVLLCTSYA